MLFFFFFSSRRRHTRSKRDWSSDVCSSDLLEGRLVRLEPLEPRHEEGLWRAAADPEVWRFMFLDASAGREVFAGYLEAALAAAAAGREAPFAVVSRASGEPVGSSRYLALRPEHRG